MLGQPAVIAAGPDTTIPKTPPNPLKNNHGIGCRKNSGRPFTSITMSESNNNINNRSLLSIGLFDFCDSDSLSEDGVREIIERHGLPHNDHHVDNYEFFHAACKNETVTEGIIQCLLEYFPAASAVANDGWSPLHYACKNKNVTPNIIQLLIEAAPASLRSLTNYGDMPLHILCRNHQLGEAAGIQILKLLIKKYPEGVRHVNNNGCLPIHRASGWRSPESCRLLIEAFPGSEQIADAEGALPLHYACGAPNMLATVEYVYNLFPNAVHHSDTHGLYPIHTAIMSACMNDDNVDTALAAAEIVKFLLDCDPNQTLIQFQGESLLDFACDPELLDDSNIHAALEIIAVIYDAHPEAVYALGIENCHQQVQAFLNSQLVHARQAKDHRLMHTPDDSGRLPLHTALQNNATLGSIKLLTKGNPAAVQSPDNSASLPLHVVCQHHDSVNVIQYLVELDQSTLDAMDRDGNTALHLACRGARYDIFKLLLEKYGAVSVSTRNKDGKLPIDLLWESTAVEERSIEYTECVYRLIRANPEMMMGIELRTTQSSASTLASPCQAGKKGKFGQ